MTIQYSIHPLCAMFPPLPDNELTQLADSIKANGLRNPIVLLDGAILDGRNRYAACTRAGVSPRFEDLPAGTDPLQFVLDVNLHRRHLTAGQKAALASDLAKGEHGGDRKSGEYQNQSNDRYFDLTIEDAATRCGTNKMAVARFRQVEAANPNLAAAVRAGVATLNAAQSTISGRARADHSEPMTADFGACVEARVKEFIDNHLFPKWGEQIKFAETFEPLAKANHFPFTRDEYKLILSVLHPDMNATTERKNEAFMLFRQHEKSLIKPAAPKIVGDFPSSAAELMARRVKKKSA
jgi:ParB-like nuclease domain